MIIDTDKPFDNELLDATRVSEMYHEAILIIGEILRTFINEDAAVTRSIFRQDELLDNINRKANTLIADYIKARPVNMDQALNLLSMIRRLEIVGDQAENIAEEIIFSWTQKC